jgi:hypothetical protein
LAKNTTKNPTRLFSAVDRGINLDTKKRKRLAKLARERVEATAQDDEKWSFLFRTPGAVGLLYCPWSATDDWEFDGTIEGLELPRNSERIEMIRRGNAGPDEEELRQWRRALCSQLAQGSETCWYAWIVPLWLDQAIAGYALFLVRPDPDSAPMLEGIYDTPDNAEDALAVC